MILDNEERRLQALAEYQLLDTPEESAYDAFTRLATEITGARMAAISLVDEHRQWFKSSIGLQDRETPRDVAFCNRVVESGTDVVIADASSDPRFAANPYVVNDPHIRFYAGVPLQTPEGFTIGTLCVMDQTPRELTPEQLAALHALAHALMNVLEGRRRILTLFDTAHIDVFTIDASARTLFFVSRGASARLGYTMPEIVGRPMYDVMPTLTPAVVADLIERGRRGEEIVREAELMRRDGTTYPVELRFSISSESGKERLLAIASDLTQRREQQREINLLLSAVNAAGDVILVYTPSGENRFTLTYMNDAFTLQTGYTQEEAVGKELEYFRKAMPDDEGMRTVREALAAGRPTQAEIVSYRKDGSTYWNQVTLHPIAGGGGGVAAWISIERDITEEVERKSALAEEHDRLLLLTRAARKLFTTLDATNLIATVRDVIAQLLRVEANVLAVNDEGASVAVSALGVVAWDRGRLDSAVERAVTSRIRVDDERGGRALAYAGRFGDARYVLEITARGGRALRSTDLFVFDLIAEYFAVALRNVALYNEIEERRAAVMELNQTKSDLITMLAHDFRGPLTSIVGFADLVAEVGSTNEEQIEFLQTIKSSAMQLSELATDTLTLSRLERNEVSLQLGSTNVGELVTSIVSQFKDRRHIELEIDGNTDVTGDEDRLRQVFTNLIDNAIKYTPDGPDPRVRVVGLADDVTVIVRDFGIGIPAGELSRIFDRFSRASNARKMRISGTGFGLYLTKQLVQLHGGTIQVASDEGKGSTFTVTLPRRIDRRAAPRTVLLVDPERGGSFLVYGLQEAGYRVLGIANVDEVTGMFDTTPFEAVILTAPEALSSQAAVQFRAFSREHDIPVIAIGADVSPLLGAAVTLTRPAAIAEVVTALDRLLITS